MKLTDIDHAFLAGECAACETECAAAKEALDARRAAFEEIRKAHAAEVAKEEEALRDATFEHNLLARAQFVAGCISADVAELLAAIPALAAEAELDTNTVARQKQLRELVAELKKQLRKRCDHPLVLHVDGYEGSYSYDRDDSRAGRSGCVVCGLTAYDRDCKDNNDVFPDDGSRWVKRMFHELDEAGIGYGQRDRVGLETRLAYYAALPSARDIVNQFFGKGRAKRVDAILKRRLGERKPFDPDAIEAGD